MTNQERRLSDSFADSDEPVTKKDLLVMSLMIENMFEKLGSKIPDYAGIAALVNTQITEHKTNCDLCQKDYLLKSDCMDAWEKCHKLHAEKQIKAVSNNLDLIKKIAWIIGLVGGGAGVMEVLQRLG